MDLKFSPERRYGSCVEMAVGEGKRTDRIDAVAIVLPNHVHFGPAKAFLEAGIHVICDKPLTTTVADAVALAEIVRKSGLIFGLTHNYTGYPVVRQAREMIHAGDLGKIRVVQVEYEQEWGLRPRQNMLAGFLRGTRRDTSRRSPSFTRIWQSRLRRGMLGGLPRQHHCWSLAWRME